MKKVEFTSDFKALVIKDYLSGMSSYRIADKYAVSATAVKRLLKEERVLRTQSSAASLRNNTVLKGIVGKYARTDEHKKNLSKLASERTGENNPFYGKTHAASAKAKIGAASKTRTKERNGNYKDGKYIRRPRDFKIHEFVPLRNNVFNRDKHTCQMCTKRGGHLHAHHRIPYWVKPAAFLDMDNLITVCSSCHFEKAHLGDWSCFNVELVSVELANKYSLDYERLNVLAVLNKKGTEAIVRTTEIDKTVEASRNV